MNAQGLQRILDEHGKWLRGSGGARADLRSADLYSANLRSADLYSANLRSADLRSADLRSAYLYSANLYSADLRSADLYSANLRSADLYSANLRSAKYSADTLWPAPTVLLLARWGEVSEDLTRMLMAFDASCHPDPDAFDRWAAGGPCPYDQVNWQRAANFQERRELWAEDCKHMRPRAIDLAQALLAECCELVEG